MHTGPTEKEDGKLPEPVAIIGMGCRFPGAPDLEAFWSLLREGRCATGPIAPERWALSSPDDMPAGAAGFAGLLEAVEAFDARFFGISPREARLMDPQQRLLLEVSWEALEHAGVPADTISGSDAGVFMGVSSFDYSRLLEPGASREAHVGTGNALSIAANRLSYFYNLHGPSVAVDTACSSSLVALHQAVEQLQQHRCSLALAGGANTLLDLRFNENLEEAGMLSPEGRCKSFDATADGYVRGEGCGVVILRRLSDALRHDDRILALIPYSAVNQDGRSNGITAPNGRAQLELLRTVWASPVLNGRVPDCFEAHGTGTPLGDPIEFRALDSLLREIDPQGLGTPLLGSVKSNIGHLEAAAGIAGVIKTALSLHRQVLPPSLHFERPNPALGYEASRLEVCSAKMPWPDAAAATPSGGDSSNEAGDSGPGLAGVSSFGFGGTNAHVAIEGWPQDRSRDGHGPVGVAGDAEADPRPHESMLPVVLSAHSPEALRARREQLALVCRADRTPLPSLAATLASRRAHLSHRWVCFATTLDALASQLEGDGDGDAMSGSLPPSGAPPLALVFSGQGSDVPAMGQALVQAFPSSLATFEGCAREVEACQGPDILTELGLTQASGGHPTTVSQAAQVAYQIALAELLFAMGLRPEAVTGHSLGEVAAAWAAGWLPRSEALRLAVLRGRAMGREAGEGRMLALLRSAEETRELLEASGDESLEIAAENGPSATVVTGPREAVERFNESLPRHSAIPLPGDRAFHSQAMEAAAEELRSALEAESLRPADTPVRADFFSTCEAQPVTTELLDAGYWARQLRDSVRFRETVVAIRQEGFESFVEVAARSVLQNALRGSLDSPDTKVVDCFARGCDAREGLTQVAANLYCQGHDLDWMAFLPAGQGLVDLPPYPWKRERYWAGAVSPAATALPVVPTMAQGVPVAQPSATVGHRDEGAGELNREAVLQDLRESVARITGSLPAEIDPRAPFIEMGADSILLAQAAIGIQDRYGVTIRLRQFFEELSNLEALADFLVDHGELRQPSPTAESAPVAPIAPVAPTIESSMAHASLPSPAEEGMEALFHRQLDMFNELIQRQMEMLSGNVPVQPSASLSPPSPSHLSPTKSGEGDFGPHRPPRPSVTRAGGGGLTDAQREHLEALTARLNARTARSKQHAAEHRGHFADCRASAGFRPSTKELLYPIEIASAEGCRLLDVDDNEYIDISMDFGVNLFGHRPEFLLRAWHEQIARGLSLSGRSPHAGVVADLLCELTGMERCAFTQSGTEAVMVAARLARLATGRTRLAYFVNSYHGHFDGFLGVPGLGERPVLPAAPGIAAELLADALVLEYGSEASLEQLRREAPGLAGILVEPVQSRHPELQPGEFLGALREIANDSGAILIFDEMITGFRVHPGGAQAHFGVRADLATYGKVLGGGQPVGAVAGRTDILDGLDGGTWHYGDDSFPLADTTFFAGTFTGNPLALASARALLTRLRDEGQALQEGLNETASAFASGLNQWFEAEDYPLRMVHFSSLFRFSFSGNLDLLFHHLLERGVFVWEGRNCFLSTTHQRADLEKVADAVRESCEALRDGGFIDRPTHVMSPVASVAEEQVRAGGSVSDVSAQDAIHESEGYVEHPATEAQRQLWLLAEMDPLANAAYAETVLFRAKGALDLELLRRAVASTVARHESLRTTFSPDGRFQRIHRDVPVPFHTADGSLLTGNSKEQAREAFLDTLTRAPFDLRHGPLVRLGLFRLSRDEQLVAISGHHIVFDGWSLNLFVRDLALFYSAELGQLPFPDDQPPQFSDYTAWLEKTVTSSESEPERAFWRERLQAPLPRLQLPQDRRLAGGRWSWEGARLSERISPSLRRELEEIGRRKGATLFMTLLSAFETYLHRLSGQDDLLVGSPVLGRGMPEGMGVIGYLTHLLPVRSRFRDGDSFEQFLERQRGEMLDVLENQTIPFSDLLRQTGMDWSPDEPALLRVTFNLDRPREGVTFHGIDCELLSPPVQASKFELSVNVTDLGGELLLDFDYNTSLFSPELATSLRDAFVDWLRCLCAAPDRMLERLPLGVLQPVRPQPLWGESGLPEWFAARSIPEVFAAVVERFRDAEAVVAAPPGGEGEAVHTLTYGELDWQSDALAARLIEEGVESGEVVGIACARGAGHVVAMFGILKAGAAYLPLDRELPERRLELLIRESGCRVILDDSSEVPDNGERWAALGVRGLEPWQKLPETMPALPDPAGERLAYVLFTSGSTGVPKGVAITHGNVVARVASLHLRGSVSTGPVLHHSPATFDASTYQFWWPLLTGRTLVVAPPGSLTLREIAATIETFGVEDTVFSTGVFNRLVSHECEALGRMKRILVGGSALSPSHCARFLEACPNTTLENGYGPTEATCFAVLHTIRAEDVRGENVPIGTPLPGLKAFVLDEHLQPVPDGVPGELCLAGEGVALGYHRRPDLSAESFVENPYAVDRSSRLYRTGDRVRRRPDGVLEFLGRLDGQVKVRGIRIELGEIESVLRRHPDVRDAMVSLVSLGEDDARLVAHVVPADREPEPSELESWLRGSLPDSMIPDWFQAIEEVPLNAHGKPDRQRVALPDACRAGDSADEGRSPAAPNQEPAEEAVLRREESPTERELREMWERLLKTDLAPRRAHFFREGGHSLLLMEMVAEVQRVFAVPLTLREALDHPTLSELATLLEAKRDSGSRSEAIPRVSRASRRKRDASGDPNQSHG